MHRRALLAVLLALGVTACSPAAAMSPHSAAPTSSTAPASSRPSDDVVPFAVVGDSITAGTEPIEGSGDDAGHPFGEGSWIPAAEGPPLKFAGGWAVSGATTDQMRAGVRPTKARVVVVLAGTNDLIRGVPWTTTRDNLLTIVRTVRAEDVVLATVPPLDPGPAQREDYNLRLRELADQKGWHVVDPWIRFDLDGSWLPGTTRDGVHPTQLTADQAGLVIRAAVLAAAASD